MMGSPTPAHGRPGAPVFTGEDAVIPSAVVIIDDHRSVTLRMAVPFEKTHLGKRCTLELEFNSTVDLVAIDGKPVTVNDIAGHNPRIVSSNGDRNWKISQKVGNDEKLVGNFPITVEIHFPPQNANTELLLAKFDGNTFYTRVIPATNAN